MAPEEPGRGENAQAAEASALVLAPSEGAAFAFPAEARAYHAALIAEAEAEILDARCADMDARAVQAEVAAGGLRLARRMGIPDTLAPLVAIMVYDPSAKARITAAGLIERAIRRTAHRRTRVA